MSSSSKKDEPLSKRLRLAASDSLSQRGVHSGHVSHVFASLEKYGCIDETLSTRKISAQGQNESQAWNEKWSYEIQLPLEDGSSYAWRVSNPSSILQFVASSCQSFDSLLALLPSGQEIPVALYHDDVQPGNILCLELQRWNRICRSWIVSVAHVKSGNRQKKCCSSIVGTFFVFIGRGI